MEKDKELKQALYNLTHLKDEEGDDVPSFCFVSDLISGADIDSDIFNEEGIAVFAAKDGYSVYKVFPGETMPGGLVLVAEGGDINSLTDMYNDFYGEAPEIIEMKLEDDYLVEVGDDEDVSITEEKQETLEDKIRRALDHNGSQINLFEVDKAEDWCKKSYDDEETDFSHLICYDIDEEERMAGKPVASFMISGGENGSGDWDNYLDDLRQVFNKLRDTTGYYPVLDEIETDIPDDVWTGFVYLYDKAEYDIQESVNMLAEALNDKDKSELKIMDPNARAMWGRTRSQTFKPKKGKGSFTRHPKHGKIDEVFVPIDEDELNGLLDTIKAEGFRIDSVNKYHFDSDALDDAADIHIQIASLDRYPDNNAARAKTREVIDKMDEYMDSINGDEKYRMTYSFGYGGTSKSGEDYTGKISAGIDLRAPWVDDEDLPTETTMLGGATNESKSNELKKRAAKHKKTDKKGARGWFINPNAGNVEKNIQHFNHVANGSAESTITAPAGLGEDISPIEGRCGFEYDLANRFTRTTYDDNGKRKYYAAIPEVCYVVKRDTYLEDRLLRRRKNRDVMKGVTDFFKQHKTAKTCVISAIDETIPKYINTYRVLAEDLDESAEDYYVVSDGKNPRHSAVYSEGGRDTAIEDAKSRQGYWEVLHYVNGNPEKIWSSDMDEDLTLKTNTAVKDPRVVRFVAFPREDFMHRGYWNRYPEFICPADAVVIYKSKLKDGDYVLCPEADNEVKDFFIENPRNQYCVLRGYDKSGNIVKISGDTPGWGYKLEEDVEKHDTLNPKLWDESNKLKPEVREKILGIVKEFTDGLEEDEIKFKVDDIVLVGSNCSYNYNDKSDLDVHIRMDTDSLECPDNLYPLLYSAYRSLFNNKMDIDFYGIPVEIYVETDDTKQMNDEPMTEARAQSAVKSNGIYSVLNDEWIKEPVAEDIPELDQRAFDAEFIKWQDRYDDIMRGQEFSLDNGSIEMLEKMTEKTHYVYIGPIYRFGRIFKDKVELHTLAVSERQAYNNLLYKAAEAIGYDRGRGAQVSLDTDLIYEYEPEIPDDAWKDEMRCERCGRLLTDNGECPLCDLGDESVLQEASDASEDMDLDDKIAEIESFIEDIYDLRKTSIAKDGEYGIGNLVFKEVRNLGYLDNLKDLKNVLKSRKFSLD